VIARWCVHKRECRKEEKDEVGLERYLGSPDGRALHRWFEFVAFEVEGFEECRRLMEGMRVLRGAVMTAGVEAAGAGCVW
jgi:hypothetical protein